MITEYDAFEALCDAIFSNDEDGLMFFWKGHYDASGKHSDLIVVAGYLANRTQWKAFNRAWKIPLTRNGHTDIFHATDFESGQQDFTERNGWSRARINEARVQLIDAILDNVVMGVACCVKVKDYEEGVPAWRLDAVGSAYEFAANACITETAKWCHYNNQPDPVSFIIEHGEGKEGKLQEAFRRAFSYPKVRNFFRLGALAFDTKQGAIGLQAADMLANYTWNEKSGNRLAIEPYTRITHAPNLSYGYFDKEEVTRQVEADNAGRVISSPEASLSIKPPTIIDINVTADFSEAESLLSDLEALADSFPEGVYSLIKHSPSLEKMFSVDAQNEGAPLANDLRISFKPNDFALSRVAALRTPQSDSDLSKGEIRH